MPRPDSSNPPTLSRKVGNPKGQITLQSGDRVWLRYKVGTGCGYVTKWVSGVDMLQRGGQAQQLHRSRLHEVRGLGKKEKYEAGAYEAGTTAPGTLCTYIHVCWSACV